MSESGQPTVTGLLDRLAKVVSGNVPLMARGFGILLLGKRFDEDIRDKEIEDPTEAILDRRVGGLGSDEMIPRI